MEITGENLIGGEPERGGSPFRAVNPATGAELEPEFREADGDLVDRALSVAEAAFRDYGTSAPSL